MSFANANSDSRNENGMGIKLSAMSLFILFLPDGLYYEFPRARGNSFQCLRPRPPRLRRPSPPVGARLHPLDAGGLSYSRARSDFSPPPEAGMTREVSVVRFPLTA